jgi:hypothetical protein
MAKLSRPIDSDTKYYKAKKMEVGLYKFLIKSTLEWGSNKEQKIKGAFEKLSPLEQEQVNVMSIRWELECQDAPYNGFTKMMWTTYWASDEKLALVLENKKAGFGKKNPTATETEIAAAVDDWRPQESLFDMFFACGLMVQDEERNVYKPIGWEMTEDGMGEAMMAAINSIVWGKIGPSDDGKIPDSLQSVAPVLEE